MNKEATAYWNNYWEGKEQPTYVSARQFGGNPDKLAQLVIDGIKTATCSAHVLYEQENEPVPAVNDYSIILNSTNEPVAIIKTIDVQIMPMNEVPEEHAIAEGEGDRTYHYWKTVHEEFFTEALAPMGIEFSDDILLVCERFQLIDVKK